MAETPQSGVDSIMSRNSEDSAPTSPPSEHSPATKGQLHIDLDELEREETRAHEARQKLDAKKERKFAKRKPETKSEREGKARELDELLRKSAAFSDILTKKTQVLGRVGSSLDGQTLGEHSLEMAAQPKCMVGGTMRDYQLEGLTWMFEICSQGMSGILADEMGLGRCAVLSLYRINPSR